MTSKRDRAYVRGLLIGYVLGMAVSTVITLAWWAAR